tara:strand:- start:1409 stop:2761 length:1353 start_codon:yes stop_codon:yes gene_type:complete
MLIYSNESSGETVSFKLYDYSDSAVYDIGQTVDFVSDMTVGSLITPEEFTISSSVDYSKDFGPGWTWFSLNVIADDMGVNGVLSQIGGAGDYIKSQGAYADYYAGFGWGGTLSQVDPKLGYKVRLANSGSLNYSGMPIDLASTPLSLNGGWNWIAYLPLNSLNIQDAIGPNNSNGVGEAGDYIKSQGGYADYYAGYGWGGTLNLLAPSEMYMLRLAAPATLLYPSSSGLLSSMSDNKLKNSSIMNSSIADFDYRLYEFNGSITSTVNIDNMIISDSDYIASYNPNGECVGYVHPRVFELTDEYVFFLMVYGNESTGDKMNFEYYNSYSNQTFKLDHNINFESDMTVGNGLDPLVFGVESPEIVSKLSIQSIYPNPFNPSTNIEYSISDGGRVSVLVYDIMGRQVGEIFNDYQIAGEHKIVWNAIDYSSGIYYIQININDNIQTQKVVLLK